MSKCKKVKNPCKICLNSVTQKNGLQCEGPCQSWVHYSCLNYTPGKIKDIKAGIIRVTCPCPDCKTTLPKEYRTDEPYSCNNTQCPANQPPQCGNILCPINYGSPEKMNQTSVPCPLGQCGASCKQNSTPQLPTKVSPPVGSPCVTQKVIKPSSPQIPKSPNNCYDPNKCPSGCESEDVPGDYGRNNNNHQMPLQKNMTSTVEQMCNTVGELSNQINELMCQMKQVVKEKGGGSGGCCPKKQNPKGAKVVCPKPCFCPGNPNRRKK